MKIRTNKEQAEYLLQKIEMKERSGLDNTEELCEALEFIFEHSVDRDEEIDLEKCTREFMQMHNVILPEDTAQRLAILIKNVERLLPSISLKNPELKDSIKDMYITLDAIAYSIYKYKEGTFYDVELPEDKLSEGISELFLVKEGDPCEKYYELTVRRIVALIEKLKNTIQNDDIVILKTLGVRFGFQSLQYEQLYMYHLVKE